jgi:hypothetical protein
VETLARVLLDCHESRFCTTGTRTSPRMMTGYPASRGLPDSRIAATMEASGVTAATLSQLGRRSKASPWSAGFPNVGKAATSTGTTRRLLLVRTISAGTPAIARSPTLPFVRQASADVRPYATHPSAGSDPTGRMLPRRSTRRAPLRRHCGRRHGPHQASGTSASPVAVGKTTHQSGPSIGRRDNRCSRCPIPRPTGKGPSIRSFSPRVSHHH